MTERIHLGGFTNTTLHLEEDGSLTIEEIQDVEPLLDQNARKRNERFAGGSGEFQEAFDIPMTLVLQWQRECGLPMLGEGHMAYMNAKLKQPEYAYLTTAPKLRDPHILIKGAR
jgi:hypothetical protein